MRPLRLCTLLLASGWLSAEGTELQLPPAEPPAEAVTGAPRRIAMEAPEDPDRFMKLPRLAWDDAAQVVTAPARWDRSDWVTAGAGAALVLGSALALDRTVERDMASHRTPSADRFAKAVQQFGGTPSVLIAGGTYLAGVAFKSPEVRATGIDTLASMGIAQLLLTIPLKVATGRSRPSADKGSHDFHPFDGGQSFPSGHTTQAFALATVISEHADQTWVTCVSYGVASLVGVARMEQRQHFLSDVVAGGLIGTFVGRTVVAFNQSRREGAGSRVAMTVAPVLQSGGYGLSVALTF